MRRVDRGAWLGLSIQVGPDPVCAWDGGKRDSEMFEA